MKADSILDIGTMEGLAQEYQIEYGAAGRELEMTGFVNNFWIGSTFEELAAAQAVRAINDITALSRHWPEDADFDAFFAAVMSVRG